MAALVGLIAHGGTAGLVVELTLTIGIVAIAVAAWLHSKRRPDDEAHDDDSDHGTSSRR